MKSLRGSPSKEVAVLARLVSRDIRTTTGTNIRVVEEASGLSIWDCCQEKLRNAVRRKEQVEVEANDEWRIQYLNKLLAQRQELDYLGQEVEKTMVDDLINSLCIH